MEVKLIAGHGPAAYRYGEGKAGVDYTLSGVLPGKPTRARLAQPLTQCDTGAEHGLTYQKCRFCSRGWPELPYLLKYAVRHYACADCVAHYKAPETGEVVVDADGDGIDRCSLCWQALTGIRCPTHGICKQPKSESPPRLG